MAHPAPPYTWPDAQRIAVCLTFDVDAEAPHLWNDPAAARTAVGELEQRRFGPRVGLPRILRMLAEEEVPATFFVPGWTADNHPGLLDAIVQEDHEVGAHGYLHERLNEIDPDHEAGVLERSLDALHRVAGVRPSGYRSPSFQLNRGTPALLKRYGFRYDSSLMGFDHPYSIATEAGPLTELPVEWLLDDAPQYKHVKSASQSNVVAEPDKVARLWLQEFDALHDLGGRLLVLTMHPWISGRASRVAALRRMIHHMRARPGVWFARLDEVARHHETSRQREALTVSVQPPPGPLPDPRVPAPQEPRG